MGGDGKSITPLTAGITIINVMLGTGPIIIPPAFLLGGVGLSTIFTFIVVYFSYQSSEMIVEILSLTNAIKKKKSLVSPQDKISSYTENKNNLNGSYPGYNIYNESNGSNNEQEETSDPFSITESFEFGEIGKFYHGRPGEIILVTIIVIYLIGVILSKCIMTGKILLKVFATIEVLNNYYFWVGIFFVSCAILSFKDISSIKIIQDVIGVIRLLVIICFIFGPVYILANKEVGGSPFNLGGFTFLYTSKDVNCPPNNGKLVQAFTFESFDFEFFNILFSNLTFAFMMQHSLPTMISKLRPENQMKPTLVVVFLSSFISILAISFIGIATFGGLISCPLTGELVYFNYNFQGYIDWIFYFTSFYIFLNVAALPVLTIVIRKNLMKLISPQLIPASPHILTKWTILYTAVILAVVLTGACLLRNYIQYVLDITGGLFGVLIMMTIPCYLVIKARIEALKHYDEDEVYRNPHRTTIGFKFLPAILFLISLGLFGYNAYLNFKSLIQGASGSH